MPKTDKQILADARRLLKRNWGKTQWVVKRDEFGVETEWMPIDGFDRLRDMLARMPNPDCRVCAEGAVYLACALAGDETDDRARSLLDDLHEMADDISTKLEDLISTEGSIFSFNDRPETTLEDVTTLFELTEQRIGDG